MDMNGWNGPIITISKTVTIKFLDQLKKYFRWLQSNSNPNVKSLTSAPSDIESEDEVNQTKPVDDVDTSQPAKRARRNKET